MAKILWGINIPVAVTQFKGWDKSNNDYVYGPGIWRRTSCFELCDFGGELVTEERIKHGITTCSLACTIKKWDNSHGFVIAQVKEQKGIRPARFWDLLKSECLERDNYTCRRCKKSGEELFQVMESGISEISGNRVKRSDYILNIYHIRPVNTGGDNTLNTLITLCGKCHKKEHSTDANIKRQHLPLEFFTTGTDNLMVEDW